jgi:hypothetical protein
MDVLNPHGSDENKAKGGRDRTIFFVLNPHGSDETGIGCTTGAGSSGFLTHTVQMKQTAIARGGTNTVVLNPHSSDETRNHYS